MLPHRTQFSLSELLVAAIGLSVALGLTRSEVGRNILAVFAVVGILAAAEWMFGRRR